MDLSREQRISKHKSFLQANWALIAAFSWEHHQNEGRGAVVVPEADFVHANEPQLKGLRFRYLSLAAHETPPFDGVLSEKELGWLAAYNPDEKVVVCILREGGGISSYFIGGTTRPSEAFARKKARDN